MSNYLLLSKKILPLYGIPITDFEKRYIELWIYQRH